MISTPITKPKRQTPISNSKNDEKILDLSKTNKVSANKIPGINQLNSIQKTSLPLRNEITFEKESEIGLLVQDSDDSLEHYSFHKWSERSKDFEFRSKNLSNRMIIARYKFLERLKFLEDLTNDYLNINQHNKQEILSKLRILYLTYNNLIEEM